MSLKRQREEPCYICGHYHNYEGGEQCKVCGHLLHSTQIPAEHISAMPTEVLPSFLYLGSYDHASRSELLKAMGITHILSVVPGCQQLYKNSFEYHTVKSSPADFEECFRFLDGARSKQTRVLVHCMTGASRSSVIIIAYLIRLRSWSLQESYQWVKDRHQRCILNEADSARLEAFRQQDLQQRSAVTRNVTPSRAQGGHSGGANGWTGQGSERGCSSCSDPHGQPLCQAEFRFEQTHTPSGVFVFGSQSPHHRLEKAALDS